MLLIKMAVTTLARTNMQVQGCMSGRGGLGLCADSSILRVKRCTAALLRIVIVITTMCWWGADKMMPPENEYTNLYRPL
jgi:hypothetical protein